MPADRGGQACSLLQLAVLLIGDGLAPLVGALGAGHLDGEVGEPAVRGSTVPVLDLGGDVDAVAGVQFHGGLALLLVVAAAGHADEDLAAAGLCVMDVQLLRQPGSKVTLWMPTCWVEMGAR